MVIYRVEPISCHFDEDFEADIKEADWYVLPNPVSLHY